MRTTPDLPGYRLRPLQIADAAACAAATRWGFAVKGWHRVQATTLMANLASQRVLEKCGFQREGRVRNFRLVGGVPADDWRYSAIPGEV